MKILLWTSRLVVGTIFILSGLIKANDPYGFSYKLGEYFEVFAHDLTHKTDLVLTEDGEKMKNEPCAEAFKDALYAKEEVRMEESEYAAGVPLMLNVFSLFEENALALAIFICVLEIALGLALLHGVYLRWSAWLLLLLTVFFSFLTFYSAYFEKVTDCGCFGDALKLTPWQSFYKDIFLLVFILPLFIKQSALAKAKESNASRLAMLSASALGMAALCGLQFDWWLPAVLLGVFHLLFEASRAWKPKSGAHWGMVAALLLSTGFSVYCSAYEPVKDYRAWAIGKDIREGAVFTPDRVAVQMVYVRKSDCLEVRQPTENWDWLDSTFEATHLFWKQDQTVLEKGKEPGIKDITLRDPYTGEEFRDSLFNSKGFVLLGVFNHLEDASESVVEAQKALIPVARNSGVLYLLAAPEFDEVLNEYKNENQMDIPVCFNDEKALKTILRSNGGLVLIQNGKVIGKWAARSLPSPEALSSLLQR
jgi:uncharacterized membrane protein YphA (DoxX/SURF4 family)